MPKKIIGMTILEIIVVVIILAIVTAFGFPSYGKAIQKMDERNMIANLATLRSAVNIFVDGGGGEFDWSNLTEINTGLAMSIIDTKATYQCEHDLGTPTKSCTATHPSNDWDLSFSGEILDQTIYCSNGTCPSCPDGAGGGCG